MPPIIELMGKATKVIESPDGSNPYISKAYFQLKNTVMNAITLKFTKMRLQVGVEKREWDKLYVYKQPEAKELDQNNILLDGLQTMTVIVRFDRYVLEDILVHKYVLEGEIEVEGQKTNAKVPLQRKLLDPRTHKGWGHMA
jgi:hypothetical protein